MNTNDELIRIMREKNMSLKDVAILTESSVESVKAWRSASESRKRNMPKSKLKLLENELLKM